MPDAVIPAEIFKVSFCLFENILFWSVGGGRARECLLLELCLRLQEIRDVVKQYDYELTTEEAKAIKSCAVGQDLIFGKRVCVLSSVESITPRRDHLLFSF